MAIPSAPASLTIAQKSVGGFDAGTSILKNRGNVRVTWPTQANVTFRIQRTRDAGTTWTDIATLGEGVITANLGGLDLGATWQFRIRAENADGASGWTTSATWTAPALPTSALGLALPITLGTSVTANRINLTWIVTGDTNGAYVVLVTPSGGAAYTVPISGISASATLTVDAGKSYSIQIAPRGGKFHQANGWQFTGNYSATNNIVVPPASISISQPPNALTAWIGQTFTLRLTTSVAANNVTASGLPAGLALNTAGMATGFVLITGAPTGATRYTSFTVTASLAGGATDTATVNVYLYKAALSARWKDADLKTRLGDAFSYTLATDVNPSIGFIVTPTIFTATPLPTWLTLTSSTLSGTPTVPGEWDILCRAQNTAGDFVDAFLKIIVPAIAITSTAALSATKGEYVEFLLVSTDSRATWTAENLPTGMTLLGNKLRGAVSATGSYSFLITATVAEAGDSQATTLTVTELWSTAQLTANAWQAEPFRATVKFYGAGLQQFALRNAPPGLTVARDATDTSLAIISGTPTKNGHYVGGIVARCLRADSNIGEYELPVELNVSGGLFIGGIHGDPLNRELQWFLRSDTVKGFYFTADTSTTQSCTIAVDPLQGNAFTRGDTARLFVVLRDQRSFITGGITRLEFCAILPNQFDAQSALRMGGPVCDFPGLTALTGGAANSLDAIVTTTLAVGSLVGDNLPGYLRVWELKAGTSAENGTTVIRPDDYAGGTNEKIWTLVIPPEVAADRPRNPLPQFAAKVKVGGVDCFRFDFVVTSELIEQWFAAANTPEDAAVASASLLLNASLTATSDGRAITSRNFPMTIRQDEHR